MPPPAPPPSASPAPPPPPPPTCDEALFVIDDAPNRCTCPAGKKFAPDTATVSECCIPLVAKNCGAATACCVSPSPPPSASPAPPPPPPPTCDEALFVIDGAPNRCTCEDGFKL